MFPCRPGTKFPATERGFHDATTDLAQVDKWWSENPDYNPAFCPHAVGLGVVDLDPPDGIANWEKVKAEHGGADDTYEVETPRGGRHLYYDGELPMSVGKAGGKRQVAVNVDTRGVGSYVLLPPSRTADGEYKVIHDREYAKVPAWVIPLVAQRHDRVEATVRDRDLPASVDRARSLLVAAVGRGDVAIAGQGGNNRTYALACELFNLGLSPEKARSLIEELWNPSCQPPWSGEELDQIIYNSSRYAQNEAGAWAVAPASEVFAAALDKLPAELKRERRSRFHPEDEMEQETGTDPSWLIKDLIQEASTVLFVGATQSYKSFLALDIALGIAAGVETFGVAPEPGPVFYAALEGKTNIKRARRRAWKLGRGVDSVKDFYVMTAPMIAADGEQQEFGDQIAAACKGRKPKLIVLDTLSKCMAGMNENDAGDAGRLIRFCDSLVEVFGCSVLVIHHTGKDAERGSRGSSAFHAGFDTVIDVSAHRETKTVTVKLKKHKDAEERAQPWTFKGRVVGPSLVFYPTSAEEHSALSEGQDDYAPAVVGKALRALKAVGEEHAVVTNVLASQLATPIEGESPEDRSGRIAQIGRKLGSLSKTKLAAYCAVNGTTKWFLPG